MAQCVFCKIIIPKGIGTLVASKSGDVTWFCSSKCQKNFKMGRNPRKTGWTSKKKKATK